MIKEHAWQKAKEVDIIQLKEKAKELSNAVFNCLTGVQGKDRDRFSYVMKEQQAVDVAQGKFWGARKKILSPQGGENTGRGYQVKLPR